MAARVNYLSRVRVVCVPARWVAWTIDGGVSGKLAGSEEGRSAQGLALLWLLLCSLFSPYVLLDIRPKLSSGVDDFLELMLASFVLLLAGFHPADTSRRLQRDM